jgi:putative Holliday junction resolvase
VDERFTSKISKYFLNASSHKQKNRRNKENLDKISASLILQTYIDQK